MPSYKMTDLILFFGSSFIGNIIFTFILRKLCLKAGFFIREKNTPYIGGVSLALSLALAFSLLYLLRGIVLSFDLVWIVVFALLLLVIEFIDDLKDFPLRAKLIIQIVFIAVYLIYAKKIQIYFLPPSLNYIISFLWIMGIINALNHLDVADGLCGGIALVVSLAFLVTFFKLGDSLVFVCAGISGGVLAFLLFNFPPAKVFIGNSGSHFLGFLFAALSIYGDYSSLSNLAALFLPVLILALPIIDTFYLIVVRSRKNILPLRKSDDHIILRFLLKGYSFRKSLLSIYFLTCLWCLSAVLILEGLSFSFVISLAAALLGSLLMIFKANINKTSFTQT